MVFRICIEDTIPGMYLLGGSYLISDNRGAVIFKRYYKKTKRTFLKVKVLKPTGLLKRQIDHKMIVERALFFGDTLNNRRGVYGV